MKTMHGTPREILNGVSQRRLASAAIPAALRAIQGARILLAEDNTLNQQVAGELLRDAGLVVDIAENGRIACDMAAHGWGADAPYHLVLMDLQMPVMDGLDATREIRSQPQGRAVPIVAMTANAMESDRESCLGAGMVDFVAKPIEPDALFRALLRWIPPLNGDRAIAAYGANLEDASTTADPPLPPVVGLDRAAGLRRVQGKNQRYTAMLRGFADAQADTVVHIRTALAAHDLKTALRLAHTLKGLTGNIGATDLVLDALALEQRLGDGDDPIGLAPMLLKLETSLNAQVAAIRSVLPTPSLVGQDASGKTKDFALLATVCEQLRVLLSNDDGNAERVVAEHAKLLRMAYPVHFSDLQTAVNRFDSERGLEILQQAMANDPS